MLEAGNIPLSSKPESRLQQSCLSLFLLSCTSSPCRAAPGTWSGSPRRTSAALRCSLCPPRGRYRVCTWRWALYPLPAKYQPIRRENLYLSTNEKQVFTWLSTLFSRPVFMMMRDNRDFPWQLLRSTSVLVETLLWTMVARVWRPETWTWVTWLERTVVSDDKTPVVTRVFWYSAVRQHEVRMLQMAIWTVAEVDSCSNILCQPIRRQHYNVSTNQKRV